MTTIDFLFDSTAAEAEARQARPGLLQRWWAAHQRRRAERRMVLTLSDLDARILRDIGIEPMDVEAALRGRPAPSITFNPMRRKRDDE